MNDSRNAVHISWRVFLGGVVCSIGLLVWFAREQDAPGIDSPVVISASGIENDGPPDLGSLYSGWVTNEQVSILLQNPRSTSEEVKLTLSVGPNPCGVVPRLTGHVVGQSDGIPLDQQFSTKVPARSSIIYRVYFEVEECYSGEDPRSFFGSLGISTPNE